MQPFATLVLSLSNSSEQSFDLDKAQITIGRNRACDISLNNAKVSHSHMRIECNETECTLIDNNSANSTFLNGKPVQIGKLTAGDLIKVGNNVLRFEIIPLTNPRSSIQ